jgi:type IV pilus assembly protein PilW
MMRDTKKGEKGVTLIELMVAMLIAIVIVAAAFTILMTSNKATMATEQVADTQQNARLAMELISQDIKLAGFNMTGSIGACVVGTVPQPAPIVPLDNVPAGAVGAINDVGPDSVRLVVPSMTAGTAGGVPILTAAANGNATLITLAAADITAMTAAGMALGSVVSIGGGHSSAVTAIGGTTLTLETPTPALPPGAVAFPIGTPVYLLQCVTYAISTAPATCGGSTSCLTRNGIPMVDGIEDLQLAYGCDGCNTIPPNPPGPNGVIDEQDASGGTFTQGDLITNNGWGLAPMTPDKIKVVQVTIVARQSRAEQGLSETRSVGLNTAGPVVVSDHNPSVDAGYNAATYSQQRRRVLTRTIQVRNIGS